MAKNSRPHFEVHPSVVYQLGESLISDGVQALIELVKNCYDADASFAKIVIDTKGNLAKVDNSFYPDSIGKIVIEDDGHGMDLEDIENGWLTISNRQKQKFKQARKLTDRGRTPLGDKGLGRLGVQRLGENLEIYTKKNNEDGVHFGFSWTDFAAKKKLQDVEIELDEWNNTGHNGTKIVVTNLREINAWKGQESIVKLQAELSRMISPYISIQDFVVYVEIDGKPIDLLEISETVRKIAPIRYGFNFDGEVLTIGGKMKTSFLCPPNSGSEADEFALIVEGDRGQALYDYMLQKNDVKSYTLTKSKSPNWYLEFSWSKRLEDIDGVEHVNGAESPLANPGSFMGEVDGFNLSSSSFESQHIFTRLKEFRDYIKKTRGIRVFRDGFAVRVDEDWLKLGEQWTSGKSYYGLKPNNTLGYVALTAQNNMDLEETTNREDFKDTPYYRNFYSLLLEFVKYTEKVQRFLGRTWVDYRNERRESIVNVESRKTVEDISKAISEGLGKATTHHSQLTSLNKRLSGAEKQAKSVVRRLEKSTSISQSLRDDIVEALDELNPLIKNAQTIITDSSKYLSDVGSLREMTSAIDRRVDALRSQMDSMYETVALGITAEALSHEIFNIADQLASRTKKAQNRIRSIDLNDRVLKSFIEYVKSSGMALRKQMSFLSPSLRYVRDQKESIVIREFLEELADFYQERLKQNGIVLRVETNDCSTFKVRMNRGKLIQIIDNFVLNSEYWLREEISQGRMKNGEIIIDISDPFVRLCDTGRGIDPNIEHMLFEPFVSTKAKGRGRGLGLFIVKQLIDSEACKIGILPERNNYKRLYKFQIDFRGAIDE